ncbi:MAG: GNAT family N-acetyltransferase, partial [Deltaproteobacteria bacterium]|nr:GNAT family N-acetyltransferase [Deltaproteobacteria bacterium]
MNDSDVKALHIETMRHEDLEAVLEIENASFPTPWSRQLFIEELQNHRSRIFLLRSPLHGPDALKAYVCLWLVEDEAHILNLAVNPLCRRQGMAATVLYYALDYSFK